MCIDPLARSANPKGMKSEKARKSQRESLKTSKVGSELEILREIALIERISFKADIV